MCIFVSIQEVGFDSWKYVFSTLVYSIEFLTLHPFCLSILYYILESTSCLHQYTLCNFWHYIFSTSVYSITFLTLHIFYISTLFNFWHYIFSTSVFSIQFLMLYLFFISILSKILTLYLFCISILYSIFDTISFLHQYTLLNFWHFSQSFLHYCETYSIKFLTLLLLNLKLVLGFLMC